MLENRHHIEEDTQILFLFANAHLSRAANTTKSCESNRQRTDELTDQICYWNVQRRERMVAQLLTKRASMVEQIRTLEGELEAALVRFGMTKDSIPQ